MRVDGVALHEDFAVTQEAVIHHCTRLPGANAEHVCPRHYLVCRRAATGQFSAAMKNAPLSSSGIIVIGAAAATILVGAGCAEFSQRHTAGSFASVRPVLESNCVHCHGPNRLSHMPAFSDTRALARLIGPANWIVPGHPERSRFFHVVTLADGQSGAMPPTGHAISRTETARLRA